MIAIRVCPTCKRKFEARVGEPQTYCEECLELKTMSDSSVCSWFFDDDDFDDDFDISEAGKEEKAETHSAAQGKDKTHGQRFLPGSIERLTEGLMELLQPLVWQAGNTLTANRELSFNKPASKLRKSAIYGIMQI